MCNFLRPLFSNRRVYKIPESGIGYKLFRRSLNSQIEYSPYKSVRVEYGDTLCWEESREGDGFTFFDNLKLAMKLLKKEEKNVEYWENCKFVIREINYNKGIGKRIEDNIAIEISVCLCKEYKVGEIVYEGVEIL